MSEIFSGDVLHGIQQLHGLAQVHPISGASMEILVEAALQLEPRHPFRTAVWTIGIASEDATKL